MIKHPGPDVFWYTLLYIGFGGYFIFLSLQEGKILLPAIVAVPVIGCILIWFDVRWAKWIVVVYSGLALLGIAMKAFNNFNWHCLWQGFTALGSIIAFAGWNGGQAAHSVALAAETNESWLELRQRLRKEMAEKYTYPSS